MASPVNLGESVDSNMNVGIKPFVEAIITLEDILTIHAFTTTPEAV